MVPEHPVRESHRDRYATPSAIALDPVQGRLSFQRPGHQAVETAAAKITEVLKEGCQAHRFLGYAICNRLRQPRRHRANELGAGPRNLLLEQALDDRPALLRQRDPDLHRGTGGRVALPDADKQREAAAPSPDTQQREHEAADPAKIEPPDQPCIQGDIPHRAGAVGRLDDDPFG
jgi:hypothetical protein